MKARIVTVAVATLLLALTGAAAASAINVKRMAHITRRAARHNCRDRARLYHDLGAPYSCITTIDTATGVKSIAVGVHCVATSARRGHCSASYFMHNDNVRSDFKGQIVCGGLLTFHRTRLGRTRRTKASPSWSCVPVD